MKITEYLVIKKEISKYEPDKPYCLYISGSGRVGDRLNMGPGKTGKKFPAEAADRFETIQEAARVYFKMLAYVEDRKGHDANSCTPPYKGLDEKLTHGKSFSCKLWE